MDEEPKWRVAFADIVPILFFFGWYLVWVVAAIWYGMGYE